jgi:hypothetical protein
VPTNEDIAKKFHSIIRYIDDVLSLDNPDLTKFVTPNSSTDGIGCIYPNELQLQSTILPNNTSHFLDMEVSPTNNNDGWQLNIFDKRTSFPFDVIRYPHMAVLYQSTFLMVCWPVNSIDDTAFAFIPTTLYYQSYLVAIQLQEKGCSKFRWQKLFRMFLSQQSSLRWKETIHSLCQKFATHLLRMRQFSTDRFVWIYSFILDCTLDHDLCLVTLYLGDSLVIVSTRGIFLWRKTPWFSFALLFLSEFLS